MKRKFYLIPCFILSICLFSCSSSEKETSEEKSVSTVLPDEIAEVQVIQLAITDFEHELIANGTIAAQRKADLQFQTQEKLAAIFVKNGDRVVAGQKIAALDPFKLQNTLLQAKDNLEKAKLELQDVLIGQGYSLADTTTIPKELMQLAKVKSNFDQSQIQHDLVEYNYKYSVLYAPFSGVVANLFTKTDNLPEPGKAFCTILDNSRMETRFMILESELPFVRVGDRVQASPFSVNDYSVEGQITEINPMVDRNGMVAVKAVLTNSKNQLYDGMNVKIRLQRSLGKQLIIPKEALVLRSNKKVIFVLNETGDKAQWVYVETGLENSTSYVITESNPTLKEGDRVIYAGNINLAHETPVRTKN
jgi:RND family efflux transporter MFP subunit